jgi:hypothetical protein
LTAEGLTAEELAAQGHWHAQTAMARQRELSCRVASPVVDKRTKMMVVAHPTKHKSTLPDVSRSAGHALILLLRFLVAYLLAIVALLVLLLIMIPSVPPLLSIPLAVIVLGLLLLVCPASAHYRR